MPISQLDIEMRLSGGTLNYEPFKSLGGAKSATEIVDAIVNNLWANVTPTQSKTGYTSYRCVYIHNEHPTLTLSAAKIWFESFTPSTSDEVTMGLGTSSIGRTEQTVSSEDKAPVGVTFSSPSSSGTALALGSITALCHKAVWIKRVVTSNATVFMSNSYTIRVDGMTLG